MSEVSFTLVVGEDIKSTCQFDGSMKGLSGAIQSVKTQINTIISNKITSNGADAIKSETIEEGDIAEDSSEDEENDNKRCKTDS